jgi:hypothetical protein
MHAGASLDRSLYFMPHRPEMLLRAPNLSQYILNSLLCIQEMLPCVRAWTECTRGKGPCELDWSLCTTDMASRTHDLSECRREMSSCTSDMSLYSLSPRDDFTPRINRLGAALSVHD